ncbi:hypothetical protein ACJ41P_32330 [Azospirillum argentinense]|uniref:Uncharacterized protein n=1 Tax=Azospirillum argentinense TaxID=2970906 RepID=A0ABW8VN63_9PROT
MPTTPDGPGVESRRKGGPAQRHGRVRTSYARKVELLELWAASGVPEGQWVPRGPTDLARWDDVDLGVCAWTDPSITSPDRSLYADLRVRFDRALARLAEVRVERPVNASPPGRRMAELDRENAALTGQICELRVRLSNLERDLRLERQRRATAEKEAALLKQRLSAVVLPHGCEQS